MKKYSWSGCAAFLTSVLLSACSSTAPIASPELKTGSDRDAQGCIASAGYSWCQRANRCERPWELAKAQGFVNSPATFSDYCKGLPVPMH